MLWSLQSFKANKQILNRNVIFDHLPLKFHKSQMNNDDATRLLRHVLSVILSE